MWFSFLEVLIVIMIVGILFVAFRSSFQIRNKDVLYGQSCIETLYGQVNNFLHAGLSSKSIASWIMQIFPDQYSIIFNPSAQQILLKYQEQGNEYIYNSIDMTGDINISYCSSTSYMMILSWDLYEIHINKWLQEDQNMQSFYITGTASVSTGESIFLECDLQWTWCKKMARFESDTRIIGIQKQICLNISTTGDCLEWDN